MEKELIKEVKDFIKEIIVINKMRDSLPIDILEYKINDIEQEIIFIKTIEQFPKEDKEKILEQLTYFKNMFEKEIQIRN